MPAAVTDWSLGFPSRMPWCGGTAAHNYDIEYANANDLPTAVFYMSQGKGAASTNVTVKDCSVDGVDTGRTLTLSAASMWTRTNSGGQGYTVHCTAGGSYKRMTASGLKTGYQSSEFHAVVAFVTSGSEGFVADMTVVCKGKSDNTRTAGWGIHFTDDEKLVGWIDDSADSHQRVELDISGWDDEIVTGALVQLILDAEGNLKVRAYTAAFGEQSAQAAVSTSTLDDDESAYADLIVGGAPDPTTPGSLNYDGDIYLFGYWPTSSSADLVWDALVEDVFSLGKIPAGGQLKIYEDPAIGLQVTGGINIYGIYVPSSHNPNSGVTVLDCPGTPNSSYTWDDWIAYTFGRDTSGTVKDYNDFGGPDWKTMADQSGCAVLIPIYYYNGAGYFGSSGTSLSDGYQKALSLMVHLGGIVSSQLSKRICVTGWSSGGSFAENFADSFCALLATYGIYIILIVNRHSAESSGSDASNAAALLHNTLESIAGTYTKFSSPPTWNRGDPVSSASAGSGSSATTYTPSNTNDWETNATAKAIEVLTFGGSNDPESGPPYYIDGAILNAQVMNAQGYNKRVLEIDGGSFDPQGSDLPAGPKYMALHGKHRDVVTTVITRGVDYFLSSPSSLAVGRRRRNFIVGGLRR